MWLWQSTIGLVTVLGTMQRSTIVNVFHGDGSMKETLLRGFNPINQCKFITRDSIAMTKLMISYCNGSLQEIPS